MVGSRPTTPRLGGRRVEDGRAVALCGEARAEIIADEVFADTWPPVQAPVTSALARAAVFASSSVAVQERRRPHFKIGGSAVAGRGRRDQAKIHARHIADPSSALGRMRALPSLLQRAREPENDRRASCGRRAAAAGAGGSQRRSLLPVRGGGRRSSSSTGEGEEARPGWHENGCWSSGLFSTSPRAPASSRGATAGRDRERSPRCADCSPRAAPAVTTGVLRRSRHSGPARGGWRGARRDGPGPAGAGRAASRAWRRRLSRTQRLTC